MGSYTRAEAAERTGLSTETIRYYERADLIPPVGRTSAGRRRYTDVDLLWLGLVSCLRDAGMPIAEIYAFSALMRDDAANTDERLALLRRHEQRVHAQIESLSGHLHQIQDKIALYESGQYWVRPVSGAEHSTRSPAERSAR
jgi:DNA-binding transcriptional MerR regulator